MLLAFDSSIWNIGGINFIDVIQNFQDSWKWVEQL